MKRILCGLVLVFAASVFARPQSPSPPYGTPPTFPEGQRQEMPPDTKAPPPRQLTTAEVEQQIQLKLNTEPALANANVNVKADENAVVLTGTVGTERQREIALRIAGSFAGKRQIVNNIKINRET
jgi:hypothetical protein